MTDLDEPDKVINCIELSSRTDHLTNFLYCMLYTEGDVFRARCCSDTLFQEQFPIWHQWRYIHRIHSLHENIKTTVLDTYRFRNIFLGYFSVLVLLPVSFYFILLRTILF